jgi:HME family heavy-metal exporter
MFTFFVTQSLRTRMLVLAFSAVLIVMGTFSLSRLRSTSFPTSTARRSRS